MQYYFYVARYERMKSWFILTQNTILLHCPFHIVGKLTFPFSISISYLTDHQIQMLKKRKCERFPHFQFTCCHVLCIRDTGFDFLYFPFLIMWKDLREQLLVSVIFALQQKTSNKTKKIPSYDRKFVVKQYIKLLWIR